MARYPSTSVPAALTFLGDLLAVVVAYYLTFVVRFHSEWGAMFFGWINAVLEVTRPAGTGVDFLGFYTASGPRIILFLWVTLTVLYGLLDLYAGARFLRRRSAALDVIKANVIALALFYTYFYLSRNQFHPRSMFATILFLNTLLCLVARGLTQWLLRRDPQLACPAVLVGSTPEAVSLGQWIDAVRPCGIRIVRTLDWEPGAPLEPLLNTLDSLIRESGARLVISADRRLPLAQAMQMVEAAEKWAVSVKILSDEMSVLPHKAHIPVDTVFDSALVHFAGSADSRWPLAVRQIVSILLASATLVVLLLPLLLIALLVKISSQGPVLFIQERIGVNRKPFLMLKYRTMYDRAQELQAQVEEFNESGEGLFKIRRDPRVTPIGRFLRRFSLDELPQLVNVIRGEMLLVGPRPLPRRDFESYYEQWHYQRHGGLPGLTCLWQVSGRSDIGFRNMCILDIYYLQNASPWLDLRILLKTFSVVLFARGAY